MTIERLGPVDPVQKYNKTENVQKPVKKEGKDSISVSDEAKMKAEVHKIAEEVKKSEDVRQDRIAEVKKKLEDPSYIDDKVVEAVAERIMDVFEL